ncbi:hypothetical protein [Rhodococcus sp. 1168]|uniref:hypothetical protein n=1 Tax=Rhodococcus sp. 1168 TaxID=2018041 RepID=UPI000A0E1BB4|nr:hypothetical protein [Rhodococcus sp. 1168]ORI13466.1 hypothetical protein BJI47_22750 [Rhodococcus sp. 1168]
MSRHKDQHWLHEYSHLREMGLDDAEIAGRFGITLDGLGARFRRINNRPTIVTEPPRPTAFPQPGDVANLADQSIEDAAEAISRIREEDPRTLWMDLTQMAPTRMLALVFALAAMAPADRPIGELLAWTEPMAVAS